MVQLNHPLPAVDWVEGGSFGGSQTQSAKRRIQICGCGAVAMTDLLLYLHRHHGCPAPALIRETAARDPIPADLYDRCCCSLQQRWLPMIPPFGINGLALTGGLEAFCRCYRLPFHARWNTSARHLWSTLEISLRRDLPVILAIGPNLPAVWENHRLQLYRRQGDTYTAAAAVKAHYVTATGLDDRWIEVSSWGKRYYIHREEYQNYGLRHSTFLVHNLLTLEPRSDP